MADAAIVSMPRILRSVFFAATCCLVTACASNNFEVMTASSANSEIVPGYLIGAGDKLKVNVFDEDTLSGEYEVGTGGVMALPLLEPISVKNLTPDQVAKRIEQKLAEGGYVLYPKVSVEILEHRSFFILGEVAAPGEYPHNGELTLEQAVAKAGG
jgi:polysaccharide export outer membrane protein